MEIMAHRSYTELGYEVNFWRTKAGQEVDFILGRGQVALEVKGSSRIDNADLRHLKAFIQEHRPKKALLVCNERAPRMVESIHVLPWRDFLSMLWEGTIIK